MKVSLLNSGSAGNCCIVQSSNTTIMIDCGSPSQKYLRQAMEEVDVSVNDLDAVLITHNHSDHVRWLNMFRQRPVYSYCSLVCRNSKKETLPINHQLIVPDEIFEIRDFTIQSLGLSHDAGNTLGFILTLNTTGEKLVYVTDTGYFPVGYQEDISNADYYIFESNHDPDMLMHTSRPMWTKQRILSDVGHLNNLDASKILAAAVGNRTRKVVLAHISREANTENLALTAFEQSLQSRGYCLHDFDTEAASQFDLTEFGELDDEACRLEAAAHLQIVSNRKEVKQVKKSKEDIRSSDLDSSKYVVKSETTSDVMNSETCGNKQTENLKTDKTDHRNLNQDDLKRINALDSSRSVTVDIKEDCQPQTHSDVCSDKDNVKKMQNANHPSSWISSNSDDSVVLSSETSVTDLYSTTKASKNFETASQPENGFRVISMPESESARRLNQLRELENQNQQKIEKQKKERQEQFFESISLLFD
ncbi:MBL fold metallo-hydrolase [Ileibacterium valens]|uniref:MBL fold metallo-hydrolase n=1 Tax=Ileibacterium valens TaxID=1862668 RepID=UPI0023537E7B|nr:MBL fold metallo-hydrolase [Ileibacterium valens]